jgi:hypothetical protein
VLGLFVTFAGLASAVAQTCTTSITGKVYSPLGVTGGGDPIPNILVYVPTTAVQPLPKGVSACSQSSQLVSGNPLVSTTTAADGSFTLTNPNLATMSPFTIVIQAGKWRRQYTGVTATACQLTTVPSMAMPANQTQGDLPHIAISTGAADDVECIFKKIGISQSEFTLPTGTGSINLYIGAEEGGEASPDSTGATGLNPTPLETVLVASAASLDPYDVVIFGCQGTATAPEATTGANGTIQNIIDFTSIGGRVFATHFGYVWLSQVAPFSGTATWVPDKGTITAPGFPSGSGVATINTTGFAEGKVLADWMQNIGAEYNNTYGQVELINMRQDQTGVNNPPAQSWVNLNDTALGNPSMQFTFDTPINATTSPSVAMTFVNSPANFLLGDPADTITANVTNNSGADADSSLNLTMTLPAGVTAVSMNGVGAGTGWVCSPSTLVCNRNASLAAGATDSVLLTVSIANTATLGQNTVTAAIAGGGLSGTNQCGRVLYNDYHVEQSASKGTLYPGNCSTTAMTAQEKFLEFSLYNLSNFVAPVTSDTINIESATVTTLTNVVTPIYYGQIIANTAVEAVVGTNGNGVDGGNLNFLIDGVVVCTLPANTAGICPPPTGQGYNAGTHTIQSVYVGDTLYLTSRSPIYNVVVQADPTATALTISPSPATSQQVVTLTATVSDIYAPVVGTVNFLDNGLLIGTGTVVNGVATVMLNFTIPGQHSVSACFVASLDYLGSCASVTTLIVTLPPSPDSTQTLLTSNANPSYFGQAVTFTSPVSTTGAFTAIPTGTVTYFDGPTAIGTGTLDSIGNASFTTSALAIGTHTMTASYAGNNSFTGSVSPQYIQVVTDPITSAGTGFILQVAPTTLAVPVGSSVIVNVTVIELNNFQQPVQLSCAGMPSEGTCNFAQSLIPATGGTTVLAIGATAPHDCGSTTPYFVAGGRGMGLLWLGVTALGLFMARKRRRVLQSLALTAALLLIPALQGCGTGNCTDFGLKPGTYTFTVQGTSTGSPVVTKTQAMTMTVTIQ